MHRSLFYFLLGILTLTPPVLYAEAGGKVGKKPLDSDPPRSVYVIPIQGQIGKPTFFILRRGLKEAIANDIDTVVLDINTPGGGLPMTVDIMKALANFSGETFAYINDEAISAGAYIAVATQQIYFAPRAIIGAAAVIQGTGKDLDETLKMKVDSYMLGNIARYSGEHPYRAQVMRAMMDEDFELIIDGETIKGEGELLTLWTEQAMREYGDPPTPLLGSGVAQSVEALLDTAYGPGEYIVKTFRVTWSEEVAQTVAPFIPIVLGLGMLLLFIEFKTPGFGFFGIAGITLLVLAFLSNYIAGLAGYEPLLFFLLGVMLIGLELFIFPGTVVSGLLGLCLIIGSLLWSMADVWPTVTDGIQWDFQALRRSFYHLLVALAVTIAGLVLIWKWFPKSRWHRQLVLEDDAPGTVPAPVELSRPTIGTTGLAMTDIHPTGEIEIGSQRYEAYVQLGIINQGEPVKVVGYRGLTLLVDGIESD